MGKTSLPDTQKGAFAEIFEETAGFDNKFFSFSALELAGLESVADLRKP
jgi:hypothetical protein